MIPDRRGGAIQVGIASRGRAIFSDQPLIHENLVTNGFSKKWENHEAAHSLFFAAYNFVRVHSTLKQTPAMAARLTDHVWTVWELLENAAALAA